MEKYRWLIREVFRIIFEVFIAIYLTIIKEDEELSLFSLLSKINLILLSEFIKDLKVNDIVLFKLSYYLNYCLNFYYFNSYLWFHCWYPLWFSHLYFNSSVNSAFHYYFYSFSQFSIFNCLQDFLSLLVLTLLLYKRTTFIVLQYLLYSIIC